MSRRRFFFLALNAFALVALFYGPLFAWSPVTPGFARSQHGNLTYLHRVDRPLTPQHRAVVQELPRLEGTFGLSFNGAVTIVLCIPGCARWPSLRAGNGRLASLGGKGLAAARLGNGAPFGADFLSEIPTRSVGLSREFRTHLTRTTVIQVAFRQLRP